MLFHKPTELLRRIDEPRLMGLSTLLLQGSMTTKNPQPISKDNIEAVLRFLPVFKAEGFQFGEWGGENGVMPHFMLSPEAYEFVKALDDKGWVVPFDWGSWQGEAAQYVNDGSLLEEADLERLRKL
jgi:hypothetical protein